VRLFYSLLPTRFCLPPQVSAMKRLVCTFLFVPALAACSTHADELRSDVRQLSEQVAALQRSQAELTARVEELSNSQFILEDKVDTNRQYIATLKKNQAMRIVQLTPETLPQSLPPARRAEPEISKSAPAPKPEPERPVEKPRAVQTAKVEAPPAAPKPGGSGVSSPITNPLEFYKQALARYESGDWEGCIDDFGRFARELPSHEYADNSLYWEGECYYAQSKYKSAIQVFESVVQRYPSGNKAPDALLKMALSHQNLGEKKAANSIVQRLLNEYPFSDAAAKAQSLVN